jgi:hypothetical protein
MSIHRANIVSRLKNHLTSENLNFASLKRLFFYVFFIELVALFAFQGLKYNCFWDDEAETAIVAKNLATSGHLSGWDGRHLCAFRNGSILDENFHPRNPIGMYLATAASFRLFGCSTTAGRFPFVVAGLGALFILFWILRTEYPTLPVLARYSVALTGLSTSYLLYIRQCRYYALCIFFALLALALYRASLRKPTWAIFAGLGASLAAFFFSHYLIMICFTVSLLAVHFVFHTRQWGKKDFFRAALACGLVALPIVWFSVLKQVWIRPDMARDAGVPMQILTRLYLNFRDFDAFGVLPGILAIGAVVWAVRYGKKYLEMKPFLEFGLFIAAYMVVLAILSPQLVKVGRFDNLADLRYMVVLIPLGAVCAGALLSIIHNKTKLAAFLLFCTITCTNVLCLRLINPHLRLLLPAYVYEITHDYQTPYEVVTDLLSSNPRFMKDTIVCIPEFSQLPIQFYCGDFLRIGGLLDKNTSLPVSKVRALPAPLFQEDYYPTLIIAFGLTSELKEKLSYFSRGKHKYIGGSRLSLPVHSTDMTRPELPWHSFTRIKNVREQDGLYFFRRIITPAK